ncbi:hypothetical protein [Bradyrhizobium sp. CCGUVB1N3]|nr:hypothetical protein [Bradyrhizobium sp. CCGUVB1N3]
MARLYKVDPAQTIELLVMDALEFGLGLRLGIKAWELRLLGN